MAGSNNSNSAVAEEDVVETLEAALPLPLKKGGRGKGKVGGEVPQMITIPALDLGHAKITLIGDSPLIVHRWSEKAKKEILDKQMKKAKAAKEAKNPWNDFLDSLYWLTPRPDEVREGDFKTLKKAKFGFPAVGVKAAAINACSHVSDVTKVAARGVFHINSEFVTIGGSVPEPREDMVRIAMGTADIRYRAVFQEWTTSFDIRFNKRVLSLEQIVNLFNTAGFAIGIGEWRPQKNGPFGMFHVATK